ncbi:MAG: SDR family NAD(P)-dependent oxidoreductase [Acidobacteriota bacterium]
MTRSRGKNIGVDQGQLEIAVLPTAGSRGLGILKAAAEAGAIPILDVTPWGDAALQDPTTLADALSRLRDSGGRRPGLRVDEGGIRRLCGSLKLRGASAGKDGLDRVILAGKFEDLAAAASALRPHCHLLFREAVNQARAEEAEACGLDAVIAKGNEGGGHVGSETTFVLLQRLHGRLHIPVWAQGGVGPHSIAACVMAGASGVVLDSQLALALESALPERIRNLIAAMDGSETVSLGESLGCGFRIHRLWASAQVKALKAIEDSGASRAVFCKHLKSALEQTGEERLLAIGQDAALAAPLANEHPNVASMIRAFRQGAADGLRGAFDGPLFSEGAPLARFHGTRYPIVQGPMTRVSDTAAFADAVSRGGGLPFLALALMRGPEIERLLRETASALGDRPWGVGILGFVPPILRSEQIQAVLAAKPRFSLLAGGRPDQARALEQAGIPTYIHVPSVRLLDLFLREGHRRFIFEGRECGGHVGPISSFVLWETALATLVRYRRANRAPEPMDVLLAGGIRDGLSAAMAAAMASEASQENVRFGLLMGSAYLLTREAVETGAILPAFQQEALRCQETVLLDSEGGHATRCAPTSYVEAFYGLKRDLVRQGLSGEEIRAQLESMNVGRLRIASKGLSRVPSSEGSAVPGDLMELPVELQREEGLYMLGQVAALGDRVVTIEDLHREVSEGSTRVIHQRAERVLGLGGKMGKASSSRPFLDCPVAVVGMACFYPGASDVDQFWRNVMERRDLVREVSKDRWAAELFYDPDPASSDRVISRWGGFLDPVPFDPVRYGIPPASLGAVASTHMLMLEVVRRAIEDAGFDRRRFPRDRTAVIIGTGGGNDLALAYSTRILVEQYLHEAGLDRDTAARVLKAMRRNMPVPTEDSLAGTLENVTAGRVANRFNFGGPNFTVDAACASSLAALEASVKELRLGTSDLVVSGAVDTQDNLFNFMMFSKTGALSRTGRCRPFDAKADGIALSEGIAAVLLKRLPDAIRDGDKIHAVLRGLGAGSDGRDKSLTAPSPNGQRRALERAYESTGVPPSSVGLVEAHGTGTVVGDRTELATLRDVYLEAGAEPQTVALGSVKSQMGHTKNAAGLAGVIKVVTALRERVLPPTLVEEPNEAARDRTSPLYLNTRPRPWFAREGQPRRAGVSAFGFGGTNFHAVFEEYPPHAASPSARSAELFAFCAPDRESLAAKVERFRKEVEGGFGGRFMDLAAAACVEATHAQGQCRLALTASGTDQLQNLLARAAEDLRSGSGLGKGILPSAGVSLGEGAASGKLAFLFPGQGAQFPNMLEELALYFPTARGVFEAADRALRGVLSRPLTSVIFPPPAYSPQEEGKCREELSQTWLAQPALGAADYAAYALLQELGLWPHMAAGLSYGEYVALCAGGSMPFDQLVRLSEIRGRIVQETQGRNEILMLAVHEGAESLSARLADAPGVSIAIRNAPKQTVVGGVREAVERFTKALENEGIAFLRIPMSAGFHIPEAREAAMRFSKVLEATEFGRPKFAVYANRTAAPHGNEAAIRRVLVEHLTHPIDFLGEVEAMYADGARTFVEVGPGQVLSGLTRQILAGRDASILALQPGQGGGGMKDYLIGVGRLYTGGWPVNLTGLFAGCDLRPVDLSRLPRPAELTSTTWLVDGGAAWPAQRGRRNESSSGQSRQEEVALSAEHPRAASSPAPRKASEPTAPSQPEKLVAPLGGFAAAETPAPNLEGGEAGALMSAFQASMRQFLDTQARAEAGRRALLQSFLETQQRVVEAFVASTAGVPLLAAGPKPQVPVQPPPGPQPARVALEEGPVPENLAEAAEPAPQELDVDSGALPDLEKLLLRFVSERTGYPVEMLNLDQNLEADLGIDSIKRTEIFGLLREKLALPDVSVDREEFFVKTSKLRTLREALSWIREEGAQYGLQADPAHASVATGREPLEDPPVSREEGEVLRCVVQPIRATLQAGKRSFPPNGLALLTEDAGPQARLLANVLRLADTRVISVRHAQGARIVGEDRYEVDLLSAEAVNQLRKWVKERHGKLTALVHLVPLLSAPSAPEGLGQEVKSLFNLAKAFSEDLSAGGTVLAMTSMGGDFGRSEALKFSEGGAALPGLLWSLSREWPRAVIKAIDVDPRDDSEVIMAHLAAEFFGEDRTVQVGLSSRGRFVLSPGESPLNRRVSVMDLGSDSVILALGGARGITAAVCEEIAERFRCRFVLVGRSPFPTAEGAETERLVAEADLKRAIMERRKSKGDPMTPVLVEAEYRAFKAGREIRSTLDHLASYGVPAEYHSLDVRDGLRLGELIEGIYERLGRIDGVIHGAGVIEDGLAVGKGQETFAKVYDTKVAPAVTLVQALRPEALRFCAFFSSVAARYGNEGQTDYAAANEALNALAVDLDRKWDARVVSVGWGPWAERGMASPLLREKMAERGFDYIPLRAGCRSFVDELLYGSKGEAEILLFAPAGSGPLAAPIEGGGLRGEWPLEAAVQAHEQL